MDAITEIERKAEWIDLPELDEKAMTYTLADAIREGSQFTDQAIGGWVDEDNKMCALSAGLLAAKARHLV